MTKNKSKVFKSIYVLTNVKVDLYSSKAFKSIIGDKGKDLGTLVKDSTV